MNIIQSPLLLSLLVMLAAAVGMAERHRFKEVCSLLG